MNFATSTNRARSGLMFLDEEMSFSQKHPNMREVTPYLRGTYRACQAKLLGPEPVSLEEAYAHIFVTDGGCNWCQNHFENLKISLETLMKQE